MSQTHFTLELLAMKLESSWRHLASNKNMKIKYDCRQNGHQNGCLLQKYKKNVPETDKLEGFAWKMLILLILELQTSSL